MREKNWRLVIVGGILIAAAVGFFLYMMTLAPHSNDQQALMQTVGSVSGVLIGISVTVIAVGLIGKKKA